jgi:hypothetical protein
MSKVYFMIVAICVLALIFVMVADYGLFSHKRMRIASAIDKASSAAIMEMDSDDALIDSIGRESNDAGLSVLMTNLKMDMSRAESVFWAVFESNTGIQRNSAIPYAAFVLTYHDGASLRYVIKKESATVSGSASPNALETVINSFIAANYSSNPDASLIRVNGNPKTEQFKSKPMFLVFLKNWRINGLFSKNNATFVSFKGSKAERSAANYVE